jgi:hypothetical protein
MYLRSLVDHDPCWATDHRESVEHIAFITHESTLASQTRRSRKARRQGLKEDFTLMVSIWVLVAIAVGLSYLL